MRMRADQVREGHRLRGAVVTRVRPVLDAGVVRISVEGAEPDDTAIANGTFCYRADTKPQNFDQTAPEAILFAMKRNKP